MDRWHYYLDSELLLLQSRLVGRAIGSRFASMAKAIVAVGLGAFQVLSLPAPEATYLPCSSLYLQ